MRARYAVGLGSLPALFGAAVCAWLCSSRAHANDQKLVLMREPTPFTDVIDAAESHDKFDINAHVGFTRTVDTGTIQREHTSGQGARQRSPLLRSEHVTSQLMLGLDIGLYHDLMAFVRVPLVLSDKRSLRAAKGRSSAQVTDLLQDPGDLSGGDGALFELPLSSPTRAGFDYVALGGAYAITSQERNEWLPTWLLLVEGRRAVGGVMKPCSQSADGTLCNVGSADDGANALRSGSSGMSRGVSAFSLETRISKRIRYAEPYAGLGALIEWASTAHTSFRPAGKLKGSTESAPARQIFSTLGAEIIPWEHRGRYQRVAVDLRLHGTYFTRGLDYTPLYDALGSSDHAALASPNYEGVRGAGDPLPACSGSDEEDCLVGKRVPFRGLTEVSSHLRYGARLGVDIRAARYVRFTLGAGLSFVTAHVLTAAAACNEDVGDRARSVGSSGQQCGSHASNPAYRGTLDAPGRAFWLTGQMLLDVYASATAQF